MVKVGVMVRLGNSVTLGLGLFRRVGLHQMDQFTKTLLYFVGKLFTFNVPPFPQNNGLGFG